MELLRPGPFTDFLARHRFDINRRFDDALGRGREIDPEVFGRNLASLVAPIAARLAPVPAQDFDRACMSMYDTVLYLTGRRLLGEASRLPAMTTLWRRTLPVLAELPALDLDRLVVPLSNAVETLARNGCKDIGRWLDLVARSGAACKSTDELLACGQVAAWLVGMAHWRDSAIDVCRRLDNGLARSLVAWAAGPGKSEPLAQGTVEACLDDPWFDPARDRPDSEGHRLEIVAAVGGFTGFGGDFVSPPEVLSSDGGLFAFDEKRCYRIFADRFGSCLRIFGADIPDGAPWKGDHLVSDDGTVRYKGLEAFFPGLAGANSHAATDLAVAITLPHSHKVFLVAPVDAERTAE